MPFVKSLLLILLLQNPDPEAHRADERGRARAGGPIAHDFVRRPDVTSLTVLNKMFDAIEKHWVAPGYQDAQLVQIRGRLDAQLPPSAAAKQVKGEETWNFDVDIDGYYAPNGRYRYEIQGDLGQVELVNDLHRKFMASEDFRAFSDTPVRSRSGNANLTNFRSLIMRQLSPLRQAVVNSGQYRHAYSGTSIYRGRPVHQVRVYRPAVRGQKPNRGPISLDRLWTFWQDGGYEVWIYEDNHLPAAVFYSNSDDNIFANLTFQYDREGLPVRIQLRNNSVHAEGSGELVLVFDQSGMLNGVTLDYASDRGIQIRVDASLVFQKDVPEDAFRILPGFGFAKMNADVLKLMVMTQISGSLLKLKKFGVNIKNFNFQGKPRR